MKNSQMSFNDAIHNRRAVRRFLPIPLSQHQINEVLEDAQWSPSNCNTQPWIVHIVSKDSKNQLIKLLLKDEEQGNRSPDFWFNQQGYSGVYSERIHDMGRKRYAALGIARQDQSARRAYSLRNLHFYGAPHVALLFMPHFGDDVRTAADIGMYAQSFLLSLTARGYAGVPQTVLGLYAASIKRFLGIKKEIKMMFGISFGYADPDALADQINVGRVPISKSVTFHE